MEDFGSILERWEASQAKKRARPQVDVSGTEEKWLNAYGTVDKDAVAEKITQAALNKNINYLKDLPWEAETNLHGDTQEEAQARLEVFIERCRAQGLRKVLIIHGKGNHTPGGEGVLGELVRRFIEQNKHLGMSGHPDRKDGGTGATWVIIKN